MLLTQESACLACKKHQIPLIALPNHTWGRMTEIPALGRWRKDHKFHVVSIFRYIGSLSAAWHTRDSISKISKTNNQIVGRKG